jgi:tRNA-5-methyluridine54 2-sulfurtransferase
MNCTKCKTKAVIKIPRHHAAFCKACFTSFVHDQVTRAIKSEKMFGRGDRILVAVSGGKDSLALWDILLKLGYKADGFYVNLGIGGYSERSYSMVRTFADAVAPLGAALHTHTVEQEEGAGIKELAHLVHRPTCSTCGTIKRYQFNRAAVEQDYDVMATGHNLDDEAARLLGNVLHWQEDYLQKQGPTLPASVDECPMAQGARTLLYKEVLNRLETESPGTKQYFYWGFLEKQRLKQSSPDAMSEKDRTLLRRCGTCGQPTTSEVCSYCKLMARAKREVAG